MKGCLAPSEIPGVSPSEASVFGSIAENLIFADFCTKYSCYSNSVYFDNNNPASYIYYLAINNKKYTASVQKDFYSQVRLAGIGVVRPDIMIHLPNEQAFYEIKPDSLSGRSAGAIKVGNLSASYIHFNLPYKPGLNYFPKPTSIAYFGKSLEVKLNARLGGPGLILYSICLSSDVTLELEYLVVILSLLVKELNKQKGKDRFTPLDLKPIIVNTGELEDLAKILGLSVLGTATTYVGWRYFWKAVTKRFAIRGTIAAGLSVADGPLPVGELLSIGIGIFTIIDIIRFHDEIWEEAKSLKERGV